MNKKPAFTLIELLVVIAIIGLLATFSVVALNNARARARDARRVSDVRQIQTALELYFNSNPSIGYPADGGGGEWITALEDSGFINPVPSAPTPADGDCDNITNAYSYERQLVGKSYTLEYCLGNDTGGVPEGVNTATPTRIY